MGYQSKKMQILGRAGLWLFIGVSTASTGYLRRQLDVRNATLYDAAARNDLPKVQALLAEGADPNAKWRNTTQFTALDFCKRMVGIDPRADEDGQTVLMNAVSSARLPLARVILDNGADVNLRDGQGYTALLYAAHTHQHPASGTILLLLAAHGADLNAKTADGKTAWSLAHNDHENMLALQQAKNLQALHPPTIRK